jgi:hypothetical protein
LKDKKDNNLKVIAVLLDKLKSMKMLQNQNYSVLLKENKEKLNQKFILLKFLLLHKVKENIKNYLK